MGFIETVFQIIITLQLLQIKPSGLLQNNGLIRHFVELLEW